MNALIPTELSAAHRAFLRWRRSRPFWGGVSAILAGIEIYGLTAAPFQVLLIQGVAGISSLLILLLLAAMAVITWAQPQLRMITGIVVVLTALASILLSNLGGFLLGTLLALHAGASIISWKPRQASGAAAEDPGDRRQHPRGRLPHRSTASRSAGRRAERGRRRWVRPLRGLWGLVVVVALLVPAPRALAASGVPSAVPAVAVPALAVPALAVPQAGDGMVTSLFCTLLPFVCPKASSPTSSGSATPAPAAPAPVAPAPVAPAPVAPAKPPAARAPAVPGTAAAPTSAAGGGSTSPAMPSAAVSATTRPGSAGACATSALPAGTDLATDPAAQASAAAAMVSCPRTSAAAATPAASSGAASSGTGAGAAGGVLVAGEATHLTASHEVMRGLGYDGVATLQTGGGPTRVLRFHATSVTVSGLRETVTYPGGSMTLTVPTTVTLSGHVELDVLSQSGKVFGLLPLTLSPTSPPPLVFSYMTFSGVDSQIALLQADTLTAPAAAIAVA